MTKIKKLHKTWMKDAAYRREYDALEEEFTVMAAIAKAPPRRAQPGRTCAPDEDDAALWRGSKADAASPRRARCCGSPKRRDMA
jgi:hypothetical protein